MSETGGEKPAQSLEGAQDALERSKAFLDEKRRLLREEQEDIDAEEAHLSATQHEGEQMLPDIREANRDAAKERFDRRMADAKAKLQVRKDLYANQERALREAERAHEELIRSANKKDNG